MPHRWMWCTRATWPNSSRTPSCGRRCWARKEPLRGMASDSGWVYVGKAASAFVHTWHTYMCLFMHVYVSEYDEYVVCKHTKAQSVRHHANPHVRHSVVHTRPRPIRTFRHHPAPPSTGCLQWCPSRAHPRRTSVCRRARWCQTGDGGEKNGWVPCGCCVRGRWKKMHYFVKVFAYMYQQISKVIVNRPFPARPVWHLQQD